ncbi:MAG TPA: TolC family protein [Ohtaekwangia sp.]|nr:TolC family protein [Ohtaekwangia sp.]
MKLAIKRHNRKISGCLLAIGLFFSSFSNAQVLSLDSILAMIDTNNPMLQEYDYNAKALDEYSNGATRWMAPMIGAGTFMTPYKRREGMHEADKGAWMFSVEQEIPNPAKLAANKHYLRSRSGLEKEGRAIAFNNLRAEARTYYYQWIVAEKKMSVLHQQEEIIGLMLKLARIRHPYNQGSVGNIYKAEGRLAEVQNMILMTHSVIQDNRYRLQSLTNLSPNDSIMVDTTTVNFHLPDLLEDTAGLGTRRSDIRQINRSIEIMRLNQQFQKQQAKPDFRIRFDHMRSIGDMPNQFTAMAMISIPIAPWSSKMYRAEVKAMTYNIEAMKKGREAILLEKKGMLTGMARQLTSMKQQLTNYETRIIPALRRNHQTVLLAYEENREQLPMVIDAWEALNMSQMDYLDKLEEYYKMIVAYEKEIEK